MSTFIELGRINSEIVHLRLNWLRWILRSLKERRRTSADVNEMASSTADNPPALCRQSFGASTTFVKADTLGTTGKPCGVFRIYFMDCKKIKSIIPRYVNHSASEEEIGIVEEHLCVCHECRRYLSDFLDKNDAVLSKTDHLPDKKGSSRIDVFNILVLVIGTIVAFISMWLFIKTH